MKELERIARRIFERTGDFVATAAAVELSVSEVIHLLFDTDEGKKEVFENYF